MHKYNLLHWLNSVRVHKTSDVHLKLFNSSNVRDVQRQKKRHGAYWTKGSKGRTPPFKKRKINIITMIRKIDHFRTNQADELWWKFLLRTALIWHRLNSFNPERGLWSCSWGVLAGVITFSLFFFFHFFTICFPPHNWIPINHSREKWEFNAIFCFVFRYRISKVSSF